MKLIQSGHAIVGFHEEEWVSDKGTNGWDELAADLAANEISLKEIRVTLEKPVFNNQLDLSQGAKLLLPHLPSGKSLALWFGAGSQLALHQGDTRTALDNLIAGTRVPRLFEGDQILISELVRIATAMTARDHTWEALQADGWTDADLTRLQSAWELLHFVAPLARSLEMENVSASITYDSLRKSNQEAVNILYGFEEFLPEEYMRRPLWERALRAVPGGETIADFLKKQVYCRIWRFAWLDQDERHSFEETQRVLEIARQAAAAQAPAGLQLVLTRLEDEPAKASWYDQLRYPLYTKYPSFLSLSRAVKRSLRTETERSIVLCAISIKRYTLRHGRPPASLESLVPDFLSSLPIDLMDGKPIKYHLNSDSTFTLYSVGENGIDDGGDSSLLPDKSLESRTLWDRKDVVWPSPALPEEVETYRNGTK
jgi:hypothetical protein